MLGRLNHIVCVKTTRVAIRRDLVGGFNTRWNIFAGVYAGTLSAECYIINTINNPKSMRANHSQVVVGGAASKWAKISGLTVQQVIKALQVKVTTGHIFLALD